MTALADIQRKVGATPDGKWGPNTAAAIMAAIDRPAAPSAQVDAITALAIKHLEAEEGRVPHAYADHLGYLTIGIGRLIDKRKGGRLTNAEIDMLLANDIAEKRKQLASDPDTAAAWARVKDDPARAVALLSMAFQMGTGAAGLDNAGLSGFDRTLALIASGQFAAAADGLATSLWAKQTPARASRVAAMLRTGKL